MPYSGKSWTSRQTADQSVTSSTTLVDVTGLSLPLAASRKYKVEMFVPFSLAGIVSGYKFQCGVPSGAAQCLHYQVMNGVTGALVQVKVETSIITLSGALATSGTHILLIDGVVVNNTTADDFKLQFAQNISDAGAITVLENAALMIKAIQ